MNFSKKRRLSPLLKQNIKLRENILNNKKILKFKKEKWKLHIIFFLKKLKRYKKYKPLDQFKYFITKYPTKGTKYGKRFRDTLITSKRYRLLYGNFPKKSFKKKIKTILNNKHQNSKLLLLQLFEKRLDTILFRSKFSTSLKKSGQLISHGKVNVNGQKIKSKSYLLKPGDIITLNKHCIKLYEDNIVTSNKWPIPPKHLLINYKTMQILLISSIENSALFTNFSFNLRLQKILANYYKQ